LRLVTGASRFLIGLVTCLATHDGIPAVVRPGCLGSRSSQYWISPATAPSPAIVMRVDSSAGSAVGSVGAVLTSARHGEDSGIGRAGSC
jgi:hypothetical protein